MTTRKRYFNVTLKGHFQALDEGEAAQFMWDAVSLKYPSANVAIVVECNRKGEQLGTPAVVSMENFKIIVRN